MNKIEIGKEMMQNQPVQDFCYALNGALKDLSDNTALEVVKDVYDMRRDYAYHTLCYVSNNDCGEKSIAFYVKDKNHIVIDGKGSKLNGIGRIIPFYFENCSHVTLKNFEIDYQRPFTSQGEVVSVTPDSVVLRINKKEFPYEMRQGVVRFIGEDYDSDFVHGLLEFEKEGKRPITNVFDNSLNSCLHGRELEDGLLEIDYHFRCIPTVGNMLTIKHERRLVPAIVLDSCKHVTIENVIIRQAGTMGIVAQLSEDLVIDHVEICPAPDSERVFSINADALHFTSCKGKIEITNGKFESMFDDIVNVHGNYLKVERVLEGNRILVRIPHFQQRGFSGCVAGDEINICQQSTMKPFGKAIIKNVENYNTLYVFLDLETDFSFDPEEAYCIDNMTRYPEVAFCHNVCGHNRARGLILTSTKDTVVEHNIFDTEGSCVMVNSDMRNWFESGGISNLYIRHNVLRRHNYNNWGEAIVDVTPHMAVEEEGFYFHKNVVVEDNDIYLEDTPLAHVYSLESLTVKNNRVYCQTLAEDPNKALTIENHNTGKIEIDHNEVKEGNYKEREK